MADEKPLKENPDAQFRFAMSDDGMKLGVSRYFPATGGREPSVDLIREQVAEAGVRLPVDEDAARRVVEAIHDGRPFTGIALVRGIPPGEPQHGALIALGDLDYPVFPQDRFARYREPRSARPGETIDGTPIPTKHDFNPEDIQVTVGDNVDWDPTTESYVSRVWGMARLKGGVITVDPIPRITEDEIAVMGTIHHRDFQGNPVTPAKLEKEIRDMGVVIDIDPDRLEARIEQASKTGAPLFDQVIVQGVHPIPGRDGWLEYLVSTREDTGTEDESGRMDFRNRGTHPMVRPGQSIARYHHPTPGEGGIDIYGKTIPAHAGRELHIHLGENVTLLDDGVTYQSKGEGVAVMERNQLSVTSCLEIRGNVDFNSGNVRLEYGSVKIKGSIQAGFAVSAPLHVIVEGSIESSSVRAGGMVSVSGGILMPEGGSVIAGSEVSANYAVNANIQAGGDVTIANEISNSIIRAKGKLVAVSGKGIIHGGHIITGKGVLVNEIGSELGVKTVVQVDIDHPEDESLRAQRAKMTQAIRKIDEALGTDPPEVILMRTPEAKRRAVAEVLTHRRTLARRRRAITDQIHKLIDARQRRLSGVSITARRVIHPGVIVKFGKMGRQFGKQAGPSTLYWDTRNWTIGIK
jgi:hypothetical protein